jgi:hypothetical protein
MKDGDVPAPAMERAFSIVGKMEHGNCLRPVVGVLFLPECTCNSVMKNGRLGLKTLKKFGFDSVGMMEPVIRADKTCTCTAPTLYYFINEPAPKCIFIRELTSKGEKNGEAKTMMGDPMAVIPVVNGSVWERFIKLNDKRMTAPRVITPPLSRPGKIIAR